MMAKIQAAIDAVSAIDTSIETQLTADAQLTSDEQVVRSAHAAVRAFTDDLKTQFVTILSLNVPQEGAGDND